MSALAQIAKFLTDVRTEYLRNLERHGNYASAHEGYAVILEELDELWEQVRLRRRNRDLDNMYEECVQIAARSMKFAIGLCLQPSKEKE